MNNKKYECGFCEKKFTEERTLSSHMCVKKRRNLDRDSVASRMGLELFCRFYKLNSATKQQKTMDEFINSRYYATFIKLSRHLMDLRPVDQDRFIDFIFQHGIKERDWCKDRIYDTYISDLLTKEPASRGIERSIKTMQGWAESNDKEFYEFFQYVSAGEAVQHIKMGRISPWVIYLSASADHLWSRLSEEQVDIISKIIDPKIWKAKFQLKKDDCSFAREILEEAGI